MLKARQINMQKQNWDAEKYIKHASFVPLLADDLLNLLDAKPNEKILDLGCGDGLLTQKIAEFGAKMIGIDASESMVISSKKRGIESYLMDGHNLAYENEFDAVFSNATLHWLNKPDKVINGVYKSLNKGGRFVGEFGGDGNIASLLNAMSAVFNENKDFGEFKNPWFFPTEFEYKKLLQKAGFEVKIIELFNRPTALKSGIKEWLAIFADGITSKLSEKQKMIFFDSCIKKLTPILYTKENGWVADYVRLRFLAIKI